MSTMINVKSKNWEYILPMGVESKFVIGTGKNPIEVLVGKTIESIGTRCYVRFHESKTREQAEALLPNAKDLTRMRAKPISLDTYNLDLLNGGERMQSVVSNFNNSAPKSDKKKSSSSIMSSSSSREPNFKSLGVEMDAESLYVDEFIESECKYIDSVEDQSLIDPERIKIFYATHMKVTKDRLAEYKYKCTKNGFKSFHDSKCDIHPNAIFEINFEDNDYECPHCAITLMRERYSKEQNPTKREELLSLVDELEHEYHKSTGTLAFESIPNEKPEVDEMVEAAFRVESADYLEECTKASEELIKKRDSILSKRTQEVPLTKSDRKYQENRKGDMMRVIEQAIVEGYIASAWISHKPKMYEQYKRERKDLDNQLEKGKINREEYASMDDELFDQVEEYYSILVKQAAAKMREEDLANVSETLSKVK